MEQHIDCFARISDVYDVSECCRCYVIIYNAIKVTVITGKIASLYIKCVISRINAWLELSNSNSCPPLTSVVINKHVTQCSL